MDEPEPLSRVQLDSAKIRCLAHPLRSRLLGTLRLHGPLTSARLADRLHTNTGATSYHLRQLADVGLVAEVVGMGTQRERWWTASHEFSSWRETDFDDDPDDRAAAEWLAGHHIRLKSRWMEQWYETRRDFSPEWRAAAGSSDILIQLTPSQLRALQDELLAVVHRYRAAGPDLDNPGDEQSVMVLLDAFPAPDLQL